MDTPTGLTGNALKLWTDTTAKFELETHELVILEQACRELKLIDQLQENIDALDGDVMTVGSRGQEVINEQVSEIRQHRAKFEQSIRALQLPADDSGEKPRAVQARAAAEARWRVVK